MTDLERLQRELPILRSIAGWSAQRLADELEVTRTTIHHLENKHFPMTRLYFIAITSLLFRESVRSHNSLLNRAIYILVTNDDEEEQKRNELHCLLDGTRKVFPKQFGMQLLSEEMNKVLANYLKEKELQGWYFHDQTQRET